MHNERIVSLPTKTGRMDRGCNQSFANKMDMNQTISGSKRKIECAASGVAFNIAGPRYGGAGGRIGCAGGAAELDPLMSDENEGKTKYDKNIFNECVKRYFLIHEISRGLRCPKVFKYIFQFFCRLIFNR